MNKDGKDGKSMDEALDRILEKLELKEAKRRQEEKLNRILEKFEAMEANKNKAFEETVTSLKATTAVFKETSSPPPTTSPTPTATNVGV
ncbi:hypothetical protein E2562_012848 [Oryza meyeriana var. granulata]|uniref:Uncharacterized protein n=1 Tax=Oryza meyeriana var. granulata TaxID=110450 RepID=A0A6G1CPR3_9ORYZ|nr:hypothetical protein E2562_012848 [Oryza meyeriana var. granulata]